MWRFRHQVGNNEIVMKSMHSRGNYLNEMLMYLRKTNTNLAEMNSTFLLVFSGKKEFIILVGVLKTPSKKKPPCLS